MVLLSGATFGPAPPAAQGVKGGPAVSRKAGTDAAFTLDPCDTMGRAGKRGQTAGPIEMDCEASNYLVGD